MYIYNSLPFVGSSFVELCSFRELFLRKVGLHAASVWHSFREKVPSMLMPSVHRLAFVRIVRFLSLFYYRKLQLELYRLVSRGGFDFVKLELLGNFVHSSLNKPV